MSDNANLGPAMTAARSEDLARGARDAVFALEERVAELEREIRELRALVTPLG